MFLGKQLDINVALHKTMLLTTINLIPCIGLALEILTRYPTMACERDENNDGKTALHVLAQKATDIAGDSLLKIVARYTSLCAFF